MEQVILFGAGGKLREVIELLSVLQTFTIREIWDNNEQLFGKTIQIDQYTYLIKKPYYENNSIILIIPDYYEAEIRNQLLFLGIDPTKIKNWRYCFHNLKDQLCRKYINGDVYQKRIVDYLRDNDIRVFNGYWYDRDPVNAKAFYDDENGLYYGFKNGKKMYLKRSINTVSLAESYLKSIEKEQYYESPHCYTKSGFEVPEGAVLLDGGAAEGFFVLDNVDKIKKAYIVECDKQWVEALEYTFSAYKEKVQIIPFFLSEKCNDTCITIDEINKDGDVNFVKLDIEGAEQEAFKGAERTLDQAEITIVACTYHRSNDAIVLNNILKQNNFWVEFSDDYMFFDSPIQLKPELRRGLIFGRK